MVDSKGHGYVVACLGDESALLIALNLGQVWVGSSVHHYLIQHFILLPLYGLPIPEDFTEQPHPQRDVHSPHLQSTSPCHARTMP